MQQPTIRQLQNVQTYYNLDYLSVIKLHIVLTKDYTLTNHGKCSVSTQLEHSAIMTATSQCDEVRKTHGLIL